MYRVTKFDVPTTTPLKSIAFYNQVFGWTFQPSANQKKWTIEVKSVEHTLTDIRKEGGEIIVPKFPVPGIGWMAYFKDLEHNIFGIMQTDRAAA